jgi:hypothetical protein
VVVGINVVSVVVVVDFAVVVGKETSEWPEWKQLDDEDVVEGSEAGSIVEQMQTGKQLSKEQYEYLKNSLRQTNSQPLAWSALLSSHGKYLAPFTVKYSALLNRSTLHWLSHWLKPYRHLLHISPRHFDVLMQLVSACWHCWLAHVNM